MIVMLVMIMIINNTDLCNRSDDDNGNDGDNDNDNANNNVDNNA